MPVDRNNRSQEKVEVAIEKAEGELQEVLARLSRLRKQRQLLKSRGSDLFARGMRELDEEDGIRSQEEAILAEQQSVGEAQLAGAIDVVDWSSLGLDFFDSGSVVAGETASTGAGRV